jgi:hypothetical protein
MATQLGQITSDFEQDSTQERVHFHECFPQGRRILQPYLRVVEQPKLPDEPCDSTVSAARHAADTCGCLQWSSTVSVETAVIKPSSD